MGSTFGDAIFSGGVKLPDPAVYPLPGTGIFQKAQSFLAFNALQIGKRYCGHTRREREPHVARVDNIA